MVGDHHPPVPHRSDGGRGSGRASCDHESSDEGYHCQNQTYEYEDDGGALNLNPNPNLYGRYGRGHGRDCVHLDGEKSLGGLRNGRLDDSSSSRVHLDEDCYGLDDWNDGRLGDSTDGYGYGYGLKEQAGTSVDLPASLLLLHPVATGGNGNGNVPGQALRAGAGCGCGYDLSRRISFHSLALFLSLCFA